MEKYPTLWWLVSRPVVLWVLPTHSRTRGPLCLQKSVWWQISSKRGSWGEVETEQKRHHNRSALELEQLEIGDQVVIQDPKTSTWSNKGLITDIRDSRRSYIIDLASGGRQTRNRRQICPSKVGQVHGSSGTIGHTKKNITTDGQLPVSGTKDQINSPIRRRSNRPKKKITYTE